MVDILPVLLAVKLPIAILLLLAAALRYQPDPAHAAWPISIAWCPPAAILAVAVTANINIGLRHILPAFPFIAVLAAAGVAALLKDASTRTWARVALVFALGWLTVSSVAAHPDYLPYFNAFAGSHPESIVADSDLDWGQDIKRLGRRLQELGAPSVAFTPSAYTSFASLGFPPVTPNQIEGPSPGWNAVGLSHWKLYRLGLQLQDIHERVWVDDLRPVEQVGKSILLFYVSPTQGSTSR